MPLEFLRSTIKTGQLIAKASTESVVEGDIIVSDMRPDIARVLWIDGTVNISSSEVIQDKVMIEGAIDFNIIYVPEGEDGLPQNMEGSISFNQYMDVPGAKPKASCDLDVKLQYIDHALLNSRKLDVKAIVAIDANIIDEIQLDIASDVNGLSDIEVQRQGISLTKVVGSGSSQVLLRQGVELPDDKPSIKELIYYKIKPLISDFTVLDNRVNINGILHIFALYVTEEQYDLIENIEDDIEFEHTIDVPGANVGLDCLPKAEVSDISVDIKENPLGEMRIINLETMLDLKVSLFEKDELEFISDMYAVAAALKAETKEMKPMEYLGSVRSEASFKGIAEISAGPEIDKIYAVKGDALISECSVEDDNINLEGFVRIEGLYSAAYSQQLVHSFIQEIPLKASMTMDGVKSDSVIKLDTLVKDIAYSLVSADSVEINGHIVLDAAIWGSAPVKVIVDAQVSEEPPEKPTGIIIYFVQPGDTLWSVAKRYRTTIERLRALNELDDEADVATGSKLIIYNNIAV
ncbi:MAG: hypothetical protein PWP48_1078 [Clostridiales bacterium]|jgi:LysM repeat protein|nr:hypothetical protein [Clostridiales bacterium]MDK2991845.1 hypothetical protein [Clostridiales bacterium]